MERSLAVFARKIAKPNTAASQGRENLRNTNYLLHHSLAGTFVRLKVANTNSIMVIRMTLELRTGLP